jgi:hypothetical protein
LFMTSLQPGDSALRFVSTFLSHVSIHKALVEAVAGHLSRRGVLAWLDKEELSLGPLDVALGEAVRAQATMTVFLSDESVASAWCTDELRWALDAAPGVEHVFPVFLGDPLKLVRSHPILQSRFLHPDGDRVNQLGFYHAPDPLHPDPGALAKRIATAAYRRVIGRTWTEVAVIVDQRGEGLRQGRPTVPHNIASLDIPALTFRPRLGPRKPREVVAGSEWDEVVKNATWGLSTALGTLRGGDPRKVRVLGNAQTSLLWAIGKHFDRTTSVELVVYGRDDVAVSNKNQERLAPLASGDPAAARPVSSAPSGAHAAIAIGVGPLQNVPYASIAQHLLPAATPLLWIETGHIADSDDAMKIVADLVASVVRVRMDHGAREVILFWATANHVAPLAAANLTSHVIPAVRFMEWDHAHGSYEYLPMP